MAIIEAGIGIQKGQESEFWAVRGKAIQSYANLEQSLCKIFSYLSGTQMDVAEIIFFKISSTDSRNKIIEKLFKKKFGDKYNLFRSSLLKQLSPINIKRNEIVHWNAINIIDADEKGETRATVLLRPPATWILDPDQPSINTQDLIAFAAKCDFHAHLCNMFYYIACEQGNVPETERKPWLDIFLQKIEYPPPAGHLL